MYRGVVMVATLIAPVLLTFLLSWQQRESDNLNSLAISVATLSAAMSRVETDVTRRLNIVEEEQRSAARLYYSRADAIRDREAIEKNTDEIRALSRSIDKLCAAVDGCEQ
jgi:hypothetical protein